LKSRNPVSNCWSSPIKDDIVPLLPDVPSGYYDTSIKTNAENPVELFSSLERNAS
jgi:hypothetical protein